MQILLVDDDLPSLKFTSFLLEDAGYRVLKTTDGTRVLQLIQQRPPNLVLLEAVMPNASGFDLCRRIRRTSDVPIIFLSQCSQLEDRVMALRIGADDYLIKPFEPAELLARIQAVLRRCNDALLYPSAQLSQGDIALDPVGYRVVFDAERMIALTPLEFRLLHYLMKNAGFVLSTRQILGAVWGYGHKSESNMVAVYIRRLRAKIESGAADSPHVITVRNMGYKLEL